MRENKSVLTFNNYIQFVTKIFTHRENSKKKTSKNALISNINNQFKANSYKMVSLAQLIAFLSTRDCPIFCLRTVSKKKKLTHTTSK